MDRRKARSGPGRSGVTLLELLLVLALISFLAISAAPNLTRIFRTNVTSSVRRYSALVRYAYDQAVMTGRLHRVVLDLDEGSWKVEVSQPGALPIDRARMGLAPDGIRDEDRPLAEPGFKPAGKGVVDAIPRGVKIVSVKSWRLGEAAVDKGSVSIYAFPNGYVDESTVTLAEDGKENVSVYRISTRPLTGRVQIDVETKGP